MAKLTEHITTSELTYWEEEYKKGGIPSSVRERPSNVVVSFCSFVKQYYETAKTAVDLGCGTGRNSFYLASEGFDFTAVDYAQSQIERITDQVQLNSKLRINPVLHDIAKPWPFLSESFDIAIDCFCFKHQMHPAGIRNYIRELHRALRNGGYYLLYLAAKDDGYYKQFAQDGQVGPGTIIIDPANEIASRLYDVEEIKELFGGLTILRELTKDGENQMHGKTYSRRSHVFYMTK